MHLSKVIVHAHDLGPTKKTNIENNVSKANILRSSKIINVVKHSQIIYSVFVV